MADKEPDADEIRRQLRLQEAKERLDAMHERAERARKAAEAKKAAKKKK